MQHRIFSSILAWCMLTLAAYLKVVVNCCSMKFSTIDVIFNKSWCMGLPSQRQLPSQGSGSTTTTTGTGDCRHRWQYYRHHTTSGITTGTGDCRVLEGDRRRSSVFSLLSHRLSRVAFAKEDRRIALWFIACEQFQPCIFSSFSFFIFDRRFLRYFLHASQSLCWLNGGGFQC